MMLIMNSMHLINLHFLTYLSAAGYVQNFVYVEHLSQCKPEYMQSIDSNQGFNLDLLIQSQVCFPCDHNIFKLCTSQIEASTFPPPSGHTLGT